MAMGIPLTQAALKSHPFDSWQQVMSQTKQEWQQLPGTGSRRASQVIKWRDDSDISVLSSWMSAQQIPGFAP